MYDKDKRPARNMRHYPRLNPVHPHNKKLFALRKKERIKMMEVPKSQETSPRWIYGKIPSFNKAFNRTYILALKYMQKEDIKDILEEVVVPGAEYPNAWHEEHKPRIWFLTKEEDLHFNHPENPTDIEMDQVKEGADMDAEGADMDTKGADVDTKGEDMDADEEDIDVDGNDEDAEGDDEDAEGDDMDAKGADQRSREAESPDSGMEQLGGDGSQLTAIDAFMQTQSSLL
ncbi:hypothetical protein PAXRUDRAFT_17239 [Paxillus rubicundulus Ve08.2h10]|uniref:Uncharacterized protein n=1 Tax=Paxillus rubicundulus Ve08.2h10 TaxID=930991 RepID=A0A0D0DB63_9AGAM|nr:hypothetical protein PAXRUDRAFT_17239 [Paxillus rubicundulus Ve08.2h10]